MSSIPQATINDLINAGSHGNMQKTDPVSNFIQMLSKYALQGVNAAGKTVGSIPLVASTPVSHGLTVAEADQSLNNIMGGPLPESSGRIMFGPHAGEPFSVGGGGEQTQADPLLMGQSKSLGDAAQSASGLGAMAIGGVEAAGGGESPINDAENLKKGDFVNPPSEMQINPGRAVRPDNGEPVMPPSGLPATPEQPTAQTQAPVIPHPEVPLEPASVTDRQGTHAVTGGNPVRLDFADQAKKNSYYLADQTHAQQVIDKYVPGDTPLEVQKNLPIQLQEETQRIKNIMASKPAAQASIDDLITANERALKQRGISPGTSTKADTATREALNEFDSQISTQPGITGKTTVSGDDLLNYKNILDNKLQSVYKKMDNSVTLTPADNAMLTLRTTINNQLKTMYPGMGDALDRQSGMLDAQPYVAKAASEEMGTQNKAAQAALNVPKPPSFGQRVVNTLKNPLGLLPISAEIARGGKDVTGLASTIGGGAIGLATSGLPAIEHMFNNITHPNQTNDGSNVSPDNQQNGQDNVHPGSISKYLNNVNTDGLGHISLSEPQTPVAPLTPGTPEYIRASNALPNDTRTFMSNAKSIYIPATNKLIDDLNTMPLDIWHGLDSEQAVNNYASNQKNPYAKQVSDLSAFNTMYQAAYKRVTGADADPSQLITPGLATEQLKQRFANMAQFMNDTYNQFYVPYAQTSEIPTGNGNKAGITSYQQPVRQENAMSIVGGSLPSLSGPGGLPPISSIPQ